MVGLLYISLTPICLTLSETSDGAKWGQAAFLPGDAGRRYMQVSFGHSGIQIGDSNLVMESRPGGRVIEWKRGVYFYYDQR